MGCFFLSSFVNYPVFSFDMAFLINTKSNTNNERWDIEMNHSLCKTPMLLTFHNRRQRPGFPSGDCSSVCKRHDISATWAIGSMHIASM